MSHLSEAKLVTLMKTPYDIVLCQNDNTQPKANKHSCADICGKLVPHRNHNTCHIQYDYGVR